MTRLRVSIETNTLINGENVMDSMDKICDECAQMATNCSCGYCENCQEKDHDCNCEYCGDCEEKESDCTC